MTDTAPPTLERAIEQAIVEGLTAGTVSDADYAALSDLYRERGEEELADLAWWMRDKGKWPTYEKASAFPERMVIDGTMGWSWFAVGSNPTKAGYSKIHLDAWKFFTLGIYTTGYVDHPTLLAALKNYYSAHQARQLMRDGSHVAEVPREVAACPRCNGPMVALIVEGFAPWPESGLPPSRWVKVRCAQNILEGKTKCPWWRDLGNEGGPPRSTVEEVVRRWCKAVD